MTNIGPSIVDRIQVLQSVTLETTRSRQLHTCAGGGFYYEWSSDPADKVETGPLSVFSLKNVSLLSSGRLQLYCYSSLLPVEEDSLNPAYVRDIYRARLEAKAINPSQLDMCFIEESCYLIAGWAPFEWGHLLVDFIPRVLLLNEHRNQFPDRPVYISNLTPDYIRSIIFSLLGANVNLRYYDDDHITVFNHAIVPQYTQFLGSGRPGYHPAIRPLIQKLLASIIAKEENGGGKLVNQKRIFVSRKHDSVYKPLNPPRALANEDDIMEFFVNRGFEVVRMEDYDFIGKLLLLSQCSVVAGGWGSGLLNSLLSLCSPKVISIGLGFNASQANVCGLMNQHYFEIPTYTDSMNLQIAQDIRGTTQYASMGLLEEALVKIIGD